MMMVVVPALPQRDQSQQGIVAAGVRRGVTPGSEHVVQGVDGYGRVKEHRRGDEEPPDHHLGAAGSQLRSIHFKQVAKDVKLQRQQKGHQRVEAVEPDQLRVAHPILDVFRAGRKMPGRGQPADVAPPETVARRGVRILIGVGEAMVVAVMGGPPQGAALDGGVAEHRKDELPETVGLISLVRKIAVVESRDGEHANEIEHQRGRHRDPTPPHPDHPQAHGVQNDEGGNPQPLHPVAGAWRHSVQPRLRVHPAQDGNEKS